MSVEAMNYAYQQTVGSISKKAVLVTLANMADHNGECFPSIQYIADRTEMTTRNAKRCLADLAADGHLTITERMGKTGQRSNLYVIDCSGVTIKQGVTLTTDKRTQCHGGGDIDDKKVDTVSPITISNNQLTNITNKKTAPKKKAASKKPKNIYFSEIGVEAEFAEYKAMRKQIRKPMNETSIKLFITALKKVSAKGHKPADLIELATANCWLSVYAIKDNDHGKNGTGNGSGHRPIQTPLDRHYAIIEERDKSTVDGEVVG